MKRLFSAALILALLITGLVSPASAEGVEVVGEAAEEAVLEITAIATGEPAEAEPGEDPEQDAEEGAEVSASPDAGSDELQVADKIKLNAASVTIGAGEKYGLYVVAEPEGSLLPEITWRSGDKAVAKVNASTGVVTGVKAGTVKICAKRTDTGEEVKCKVTVKAAPKKVSLNAAALTLSAGMTSQLKATLPGGAASATMTFSSSKPAVAAVDESGAVTALQPGKATITVKTFNGKKATCKVTVKAAPASVAFPEAALSLAVGQTASLNAEARTAGGDATPAVIAYAVDESSPDAGCVRLEGGKLTGVRQGRAILRATSHNGVTGLCEVEVAAGPKSVSLNTSSVSIGVKETCASIRAELTPPDGAKSCAKTLTWTSSNKKVARVDAATGAVTGVKAGTCTITATAANGKSAKCKVRVLKAPTSLSVSPAVGALAVGETGRYRVSLPKNCGGSVSYKSSDTSVATVDSQGVVTGVACGTAKITVSTYNGKSKTVQLIVGDGGSGENKSARAEMIQYVMSIAQKKLSAPYVYGSFGPNSFDCSGFVYWCYKQVNVKLKDSAYRQGYDDSYPMVSFGSLVPGDLVFFDTVADSDLSDHAGLYLGEGKFIHASSSAKKVIVSTLTSGYYRRSFSWGRRILY